MRIACVYLPVFPLQALVREAPHLAGEPVAVLTAEPRPVVVACSRAAWDAGVRPGALPAQARALSATLRIAPVDSAACRRTLGALADVLLALSPEVDAGPLADTGLARALFVAVPARTRGADFGERLLATATRQGLRARVGIADDRFTARAAATAAGEQGCRVIPHGGAAAFLAPQPLALLPLDNDVRGLLGSLGVRTLGDFAALPPPSVGQRWGGAEVDLRALAAGEGPTGLARYPATEPIVERTTTAEPVDGQALGFLVRPLVERVCERLAARGQAASRLALRLEAIAGPAGVLGAEMREVALPRPSRASVALLERVREALAGLGRPVAAITLEVIAAVELEQEAQPLFAAATAGGPAGGAEAAGRPPGGAGFRLTPFSPPRARRPPRRAPRGKRREAREPLLAGLSE